MKYTTYFGVSFPLLCATLWAKYPAIVLLIAPKYLDEKLVHYLFPDKTKKNHRMSTMEDMPAVTIMTDHKVKVIQELFTPDGTPKVARKFMTPLPEMELLDKLASFNVNKTVRLIDMTRTEDHFSPSCSSAGLGAVMETDCSHYIRNGMMQEEDPKLKNMWAGFEAITDKEHVEILLGGGGAKVNLDDWGDYKQNNLFLSNLDKAKMSAPTHCAPIDSLVVQMAGTKTWVFTSPLQLSTISSIPMPTFFNLPTTDDELLSQMGEVRLLTTGPGDVLYFGPNWCHAVVTEGGPNVMFNVRYFAMEKIRAGPFNLLAKIVWRTMTRQLATLPQDNAEVQGPIYGTLNKYFPACGVSDKVLYIMDRVKKHVSDLGLA